jgi:4-hydroxyphenylpyruvate dioxygenase-like putative hemolysin
MSTNGAVDLDLDRDKLSHLLDRNISLASKDEYLRNRDSIITAVLQSRYRNLHNLLGDNVSEQNYLGIVKNQILVDIQGGDLLYQIFTSNILQRNACDEAPFFEFIQRVCSKDVVKPGCGGFGTFYFVSVDP